MVGCGRCQRYGLLIDGTVRNVISTGAPPTAVEFITFIFSMESIMRPSDALNTNCWCGMVGYRQCMGRPGEMLQLLQGTDIGDWSCQWNIRGTVVRAEINKPWAG